MFRLGVQRFEWLSKYLPLNSDKIARQWVDNLDNNELLNATYNNWAIGNWIKSSVHTHLRISRIDIKEPIIEKVFRSYLYSGLLACFGLSRLMEDYRPDVLFIFNGRMSSTRIALELANQRKVRVVCHERGFRRESIRLTVNDSIAALQPYKKLHNDWGKVPLIKEEIKTISQYMVGKKYGKDTGWMALSPPPQEHDEQKLGFSHNSVLWALFVSSEDEVAAHNNNRREIFDSQMDWIQKTVAYVERHPGIEMVIRIHPNIAGEKAAGQSVSQLNAFKELSKNLPDNVCMVYPDDPVSSYSLMELATVGLVYFSTVGLEMACMGKQVIAAANSRMMHSSFVRTVITSDSYETILDEMLKIPQRAVFPEIQRLACRHAYALFFRYNIPFPLVKMQDKTHGVPAYKSFDELLPGRDSNLDRVCRIILEKEAAIPTPSAEERLRSEEDEIAWFKLKRQRETKVEIDTAVADHLPEISIVVPTYNYGHFINQCLQSVLDQTYQDYEVIIMDDNSSDNTKNIIQEYLTDNRMRYIHNKVNLKQPRNCNKGSLFAKGEFIYFLHADDMFLPQNLEKKIRVLKENLNIAAVFSGVFLMNENGDIVQELEHSGRPDHSYVGDRDDYHDLMKYNYIPTPSDVLIRKECFEKVGKFNEKLINGCDWELWIRLAKDFKLAFVREPLIGYRLHGTNLHSDLRRKNDVVVRDHFWIIDNHLHINDEDIKAIRIRDNAYVQIAKTIGEIPKSYEKLYTDALNLRINPSVFHNGDSDEIKKLNITQAFKHADENQKNEDYIGAVKVYLKLLQREDADPIAVNYHLGRIWMKLLKFDEAASCFYKILENHLSYPRAYKCLGDCYQQMNLLDKAEMVYRRGLKILPQNYILRKSIVDLYLEQWRLDSAIDELQLYLELCSNDTQAIHLLDECYSTKNCEKK
jgi:glycosyltransferase involved in cell wall biosynthesis